MYAAGFTDKGQTRSQNQDAIFVCCDTLGPLPNLFILADGMGGHNAGEIASARAVDYIADYIRNFKAAEFVQPDNFLDLLVSAVQEANSKIYKMSEDNPEMQGMGTTIIVCTVYDKKIIMVHVGDSRAYVVAPTHITQITEDHTYVEEMIQAGELTSEEANIHPNRHVITRALGISGPLEADGIVRPLSDTTTVVLCSDGLSDMLDDDAIKGIVEDEGFVEHRTKHLIEEANLRGGHDNISAILIDVNRA